MSSPLRFTMPIMVDLLTAAGVTVPRTERPTTGLFLHCVGEILWVARISFPPSQIKQILFLSSVYCGIVSFVWKGSNAEVAFIIALFPRRGLVNLKEGYLIASLFAMQEKCSRPVFSLR